MKVSICSYARELACTWYVVLYSELPGMPQEVYYFGFVAVLCVSIGLLFCSSSLYCTLQLDLLSTDFLVMVREDSNDKFL